jgi:hypothetical protein
MAVLSSKLGSHGVRIVADCCLIDFLAGELPSTPGTLTRDLRKLSIPVIPKLERTSPAFSEERRGAKIRALGSKCFGAGICSVFKQAG